MSNYNYSVELARHEIRDSTWTLKILKRCLDGNDFSYRDYVCYSLNVIKKNLGR